MTVKMNTLCIY